MQNIVLAGGLISVAGLTSSSHVSIDNGNTRTASATSDISALSLDNGAIQIGGLHWAASQTSGAATASTGTFSIGSLKALGRRSWPTVPESPQTILNIINTVGALIGFNIQWPVESTLPDGTVQISPLTIGLDNNDSARRS